MTVFIAELIRAANETSKLSPIETARLLRRAAASIRDSRERIEARSPTHDPGHDIVFELTVMASSIDLFPREKVAAMFLEAAQDLRASKMLLEAKKA
jgi:hypothetical protein